MPLRMRFGAAPVGHRGRRYFPTMIRRMRRQHRTAEKVGEMLEERMYLIEMTMQPLLHRSREAPAIHRHDGEKCGGGASSEEEDQVNIKATTEEGLALPERKREFRTGDLLHFQGTRPDAGRPDRRRMQRLPGVRKERRRIKEKCDCTRPEDVVD